VKLLDGTTMAMDAHFIEVKLMFSFSEFLQTSIFTMFINVLNEVVVWQKFYRGIKCFIFST